MRKPEILSERIVDCDICGRCPAHVCMLERVEGRLIYYNRKEYVGHFCATCVKRAYANYTGWTLILGWWSTLGIVRTPYVIAMNTYEFISCLIKLRQLARRMQWWMEEQTLVGQFRGFSPLLGKSDTVCYFSRRFVMIQPEAKSVNAWKSESGVFKAR